MKTSAVLLASNIEWKHQSSQKGLNSTSSAKFAVQPLGQ